MDSKKEIAKKIKDIFKMCNGFLDNNLMTINDDLLYYN